MQTLDQYLIIMAEIPKNKLTKKVSRLFVLTILLTLIFSSVLPAGAAEPVTGSYFSEDYIQDIINNTPAADTAHFKQAKSDANTIAVSGAVPVLSKGRESYEWFVLLQGVMKKVNDEGKLEPYLWDNGGCVIGYGCPSSYIQIYVYSESDYSEEDISAVIQIIQEAGKSYGINDIPVIVEINTHAQGYLNSGSVVQNEPEKTIPGVGLAACIVLSLVVVFFIRKSKK